MNSVPDGDQVRRESLASLGGALRAMREGQGLSLEDVERDTKIRRAFLEAIESGEVQRIPGMAYARGFVRNYCEYLKAPDLWPRFDELLRGDQDEVLGSYAPPRTAFRRSSRWWLYAVLVGAVAFASYLLFQQWQDFKTRMMESVITKPAEPTLEGPQDQAQVPASEDLVVEVSPDQPGQGAVSGAVSGEPVSGEASMDLSWMDGGAPKEPKEAEERRGAPGVTVRAIGVCWVKVTDLANNAVVFQGTLKDGQEMSFESPKGLRVRLGNAGSASLKTSSAEMSPAGPKGIPRTYYVLPDGTIGTKRPR